MTEAPRRELGWVHATGIVVGAIIGVGIFITPGKVAGIGGSPIGTLALWACGGLIAVAGALSLAEIGARYPMSGGQIIALKHSLGRLPAFLYGWCLLLAIQTGVLVIITLFGAQNLGVAMGLEWSETQTAGVASLLLASLVVANVLGARQGARVQTSTSLAKLAILAALAVLGCAVFLGVVEPTPGSPAAAPVAAPGDPKLPWIAGLAAVLFSYGGFHQLTWVGGEVSDPHRAVPRAIVLGIGIVITAYLAVNLAYLALIPYPELVASSTPAADAVGRLFPGWGRRATAAALCVSAFGIANASLLTAPRVYYALARENLFLPGFRSLHAGSGVPRAAILLQSALALALLWLVGNDMNPLVTGVVFVDWTFHALTCLGLILLRRRPDDQPPDYRAPGVPWVPAVFILGTFVGLGATFLDPDVRQASLLGLAVLGSGMPVFWLASRSRRRSQTA